MKLGKLLFCLLIVIVLLPACTSAPATKIVPTLAPFVETPIALPTLDFSQILTTPTAAIPTRTPLPASLPNFPLEGYVMLLISDGDLYFQDGNNSPIQLTHFEEKITYYPYPPRLSSDNQKVVFAQEDGSNIYSVNVDGTRSIIISKDRLDMLGAGAKIGALDFVPNTHQLFFLAVICKSKGSNSPCPTIAYLVDADTGEIKKLMDLGMVFSNLDIGSFPRNVKISPDGKMLAVGTLDGVDIFSMDGKHIYHDMLPYIPSTSTLLFPSLFWLPDSSGLIIALPNTTYYAQACGDLPANTLWRYTLDSNATVQISLEPSPMMDTFQVSPDGEWIVYGGYCQPLLYLGNLANEQVQILGSDDSHPSFFWSSDSMHLIAGWTVVTSFNKQPLIIGSGSKWVDTNHFTYYDLPANNPTIQQERVLIGEIVGDEIYYYDLNLPYLGLVTIKPKQ